MGALRPHTTLAHDMARRADRHGGRTAVVFTSDDGRPGHLDYAGLAGRAAAVAARLRALRASRRTGEHPQFVLIALPNGLDYVVSVYGCLIAGAVAVPFYPPTSMIGRTARVFGRRLAQIWRDCRPAVIILPSNVIDLVRDELAAVDPAPHDGDTVLLPAEDLWAASDPTTRIDRLDARPGDLALLQYTSGSTLNPRGVMITHANLAHNVAAFAASLGSTDGESIATWLPLFHDLGLIGAVLHPLAAGMTVHLTTPSAFVRRPFGWLDAISRSRASIIMAPNFAFDLAVRSVTEPERSTLDLSHLRAAVIAAEPVRPTTIEAFVKAYERYGFRPGTMCPGYGLAEATLCVTVSELRREPVLLEVSSSRLRQDGVAEPADHEPTTVLTGCGPDVPDTATVIVDPLRSVACPDGTVGEIWITGPGVAAGYWNQRDLSEQLFAAQLPDDGRQFLRTGDLGVKIDDVLYVVGRIKDLIIQHGVNHYPQDVEFTAESAHPALRPGGTVAFAVAADGGESVVVLCELNTYRDRAGYPTILNAVRTAIAAEHGLELGAVALVRKGQIPKTTSGKLRRRESADRWLADEFHPVAR
jgi:acyl-CoA synthetase (AMP-forming)/AMP-acid ligase II